MNIKDYREKELKTLVIANILVILCLNGLITFDGILEENNYMKLLVTIINSGLFASIIYTLVTVCDCMISSELKRYIVFWWCPMPGETVFSDIKTDAKDGRFTSAEAIESYEEIIICHLKKRLVVNMKTASGMIYYVSMNQKQKF